MLQRKKAILQDGFLDQFFSEIVVNTHRPYILCNRSNFETGTDRRNTT